jgi:hypothetical protein
MHAAVHSCLYLQVGCFGPYAFFDCREGVGRSSGASIVNAEEVELVATVLQKLHLDYPGELGKVAVLTPYKAQKMASKIVIVVIDRLFF